MRDSSYVYKKEVDWSLLHQGLSIPITIQVVFQNNIERFLQRGQSKDISLVIDGITYKAKLINQTFDTERYGDRSDILQIRYNPQSELACKLREIYRSSYQFIKDEREKIINQGKKPVKIPVNKKEFLAIYTTLYEDTYYMDCITIQDMEQFSTMIAKEDEAIYEKTINFSVNDENARIDTILGESKIRKLNRSIGDNLKLLYGYRCQICGQNFGSPYDVNIVEAHHIDAFVSSLNNNVSNQIIVCPNHHSVIHRANPVFERNRLSYVYANGMVERIVLDKHLTKITNMKAHNLKIQHMLKIL